MTRARDVSNTINTSNFAAKNWFLNGACDFWQRGTSYSGAQTNLYLMDRWLGINVSAVSRSTDVPTETNFQYSMSFGHSTASYPLVCYRMPSEESRFLAGKVVTLSFWAKNVTGTAVLYGELLTPSADNNFGTLTNLGAVGVFSYAPSSSWVRYSSTFTVTADSLRGLEFRIVRDAGSAATTLVTGMQLEIGRAVTGFQRRSGDYSSELNACQRYYQQINSANPDAAFPIVRESTTAGVLPLFLPVTMRATPVLQTTAGYGRIVAYDTAFSLSTATVSAAAVKTSALNNSMIEVGLTHSALAGTFVHCQWDPLGGGLLGLSSEL